MIDMSYKLDFFDRAAIKNLADKVVRKGLSKFGAFVRRRARSSIRKSKKISEPGKPPRAHSPEPNLRTIVFAYERHKQEVVVGPVLLRSKAQSTDPVPGLQEHGRKTTLVRETKRRTTRRVIRIRPRPFMGPAMQKEVEAGGLKKAIGPR